MSDITSLSAFDRWLVCGDSSGAVRVIDMKVVVVSQNFSDAYSKLFVLL